LIIGISGLYWSINQQDVILESDFYEALYLVLPNYVWGVLLLAFGVSLIIASFFYGSKKVNNLSYKLVIMTGTGGALIHILMISAALFNAINWITPAQFLVMTGLLGFVGFVAGVELYGRR